MTSSAFDDLVGSANAALLVVTTAVDDVKAGCLVGYHNQSSMSPRQYSFWLSKANHTYRVGLLATHFVVHFLTEHDYDLAERFAATSGQNTDKFADLSVETDEFGLPLITALPNRMVVERLTMLDDGGDLVCRLLLEKIKSGRLSPVEPGFTSGASSPTSFRMRSFW